MSFLRFSEKKNRKNYSYFKVIFAIKPPIAPAFSKKAYSSCRITKKPCFFTFYNSVFPIK